MNEPATDKNMPDQCPQCGAALPAGALEGLCPACLLKQGAETGPPPLSVPFQPPSLEEVARWFPQLQILAFIGKGGMGAVYQARQPALDRLVALKILPPQAAGGPGFAERFNREARALARLNHPNIVAVHEFGQAGGSPFFLMEFVDGLTLRQLEHAGRLSPDEALRIVPQICEALQYAHDEGIVHRDIKPENILIDKKGRVKIADFGIAKILGGEGRAGSPLPAAGPSAGLPGKAPHDDLLTETRQAIGTPHYMAPEQLEQPQTVDHRADIFSLGVVFYEMLTGQLPLGKFAPPSRKVQMDARLDEVVLRALEREPELRYQRAAEVKTEIDTTTSTPPGPPKFSPEPGATPSGENTRPRVFQPAPPPAGSIHSSRQVFAWLALGFFIVGLLGGAFLVAMHASEEGVVAFLGLSLALVLIFGMISLQWRGRLVVTIAMLGLLALGVVPRLISPPSSAVATKLGLWFIIISVAVFVVGLQQWLAQTAARNTPQPPSPAVPDATRRVFAWLALGFFIVGLCPFLMALGAEDDADLIFRGLGLAMAMILGLVSWRERLGRVIAMVTFGLLALAAIPLFNYMRQESQNRAEARQPGIAARNAKPIRDAYEKARQRLANLEALDAKLESHYTTNHPQVKANRIEIEAARAELKRLEEAHPGLRALEPADSTTSGLAYPAAPSNLPPISPTKQGNAGQAEPPPATAVRGSIGRYQDCLGSVESSNAVVFDLVAPAAEEVVKKLDGGNALPVEVLDQANNKFGRGILLSVNRQVDPATGTVKCKASLQPEPDRVVFINQYVHVRLLLETIHDAVFVPVSALIHDHPDRVLVINPDRSVTRRDVVVGIMDGPNVEIRSGLLPGEKVVGNNAARLDQTMATNTTNPTNK